MIHQLSIWVCPSGHTNRRSNLQCGWCKVERQVAPLPTSHALPDVLGFEDALAVAIEQAGTSSCMKSKRGVVIWSTYTGELLASGTNRPPPRFPCDGSFACRTHCNKLCTHAELNAILDVGDAGCHGDELLHVKIIDGRAVASGPPSCWQCSRQIVAEGIGGVWLLHDEGWKRYVGDEFHEATLRHCELPVIRTVIASTKERMP